MSDKNEYMLVCFLDVDLAEEQFTTWPLHITLIPWFIPYKLNEFKKCIQSAIGKIDPFIVAADREETWQGLKINLLQPSSRLQALHDTLLGLVSSNGESTARQRYVGRDFKPHVTQKSGVQAQPGQKILIDRVYLISAPASLVRSSRTKEVIDSFRLGGNGV